LKLLSAAFWVQLTEETPNGERTCNQKHKQNQAVHELFHENSHLGAAQIILVDFTQQLAEKFCWTITLEICFHFQVLHPVYVTIAVEGIAVQVKLF
jgi:hypothetical protein